MARIFEQSAITELAAAKVNLTLRVLGRRVDGYHELESLVVFADVGDVLTLDPRGEDEVSVRGPFADGLSGPNLVAVALERLAAAEPGLRLGAVTLDKRLPVAAGVGGGSADAAAVLRAVRGLNPDFAEAVDWEGIARGLGADVPVCLARRSAWMAGTGEQLTACEVAPLAAVLVNPLVPVPADKTRRVFLELGAGQVAGESVGQRPYALGLDEVLALARAVGNDLARPARRVIPAIADVEAALAAAPGCLHAQLSGGGPTCFGLFQSREAAQAGAAALHAAHPGWWIVAATLG